jgi:hypothetical protein
VKRAAIAKPLHDVLAIRFSDGRQLAMRGFRVHERGQLLGRDLTVMRFSVQAAKPTFRYHDTGVWEPKCVGPILRRPLARHPADFHASLESRREAFRGPFSEGIDRMLWLLNRDFVKGIIPQRISQVHQSLSPRLSK